MATLVRRMHLQLEFGRELASICLSLASSRTSATCAIRRRVQQFLQQLYESQEISRPLQHTRGGTEPSLGAGLWPMHAGMRALTSTPLLPCAPSSSQSRTQFAHLPSPLTRRLPLRASPRVPDIAHCQRHRKTAPQQAALPPRAVFRSRSLPRERLSRQQSVRPYYGANAPFLPRQSLHIIRKRERQIRAARNAAGLPASRADDDKLPPVRLVHRGGRVAARRQHRLP